MLGMRPNARQVMMSYSTFIQIMFTLLRQVVPSCSSL